MLLRAGLSSVCFRGGGGGASRGDVYFEYTEHTLWRRVIEYCSCIAIFLAEVCFVCSREASHQDVSFEHTANAFWWKIMENYRP